MNTITLFETPEQTFPFYLSLDEVARIFKGLNNLPITDPTTEVLKNSLEGIMINHGEGV